MRYFLALVILIFIQKPSWASELAINNQASVTAIQQVLKDYIEGTSYNNKQQIAKAFNPAADLLLEKEGQAFTKVTVADYLNWYKSENQGKFNGRIGEILQIDVGGDLATAKAEIIIPGQQRRFIDVFLLKNIDSHWQIISKAAVKQASKQNGARILFIVSNAHFHGTSKLPTGASFSEIVNAYHTFKQAGYTVDFVSPEGGAVPLSYIDTSNALHKAHLYDSEFMFALKNTKKATQLMAKDYRAVHYIGGGNAMYGVADNVEISRLVMEIYEQHKGIISSVCHGTAGIVHLKTKDGKYLVDGKRISGYPEDFEKPSAEYFKQFPFLIKQTVLSRNGTFHFGKPDEAYIEVDGRVVTGQNYQSSALVAEAIIKQLQKEQVNSK
ncbi:nuclear transport factor 2 family protein [Undibacterium sp. Di24W]|uniref:nuclear transport factor 2 family protein n=1 Tax=Undibacterium sp. Di24W TaxID=3413033 RepID=UPI003BF2EF9B